LIVDCCLYLRIAVAAGVFVAAMAVRGGNAAFAELLMLQCR
jgi:hypothetical protein